MSRVATDPGVVIVEPRPLRIAEQHAAMPDLASTRIKRSELQRRVDLQREAHLACNDAPLAVFAFPMTQQLCRMAGVSSEARIGLITRDEMERALQRIRCGVTPHAALASVCEITPHAAQGWMRRGADPAEQDPRYGSFYIACVAAQSDARAAAEEAVTASSPLAALTRGPLGRTTADLPGWSDEPPPVAAVSVNVNLNAEQRRDRIAVLVSRMADEP